MQKQFSNFQNCNSYISVNVSEPSTGLYSIFFSSFRGRIPLAIFLLLTLCNLHCSLLSCAWSQMALLLFWRWNWSNRYKLFELYQQQCMAPFQCAFSFNVKEVTSFWGNVAHSSWFWPQALQCPSVFDIAFLFCLTVFHQSFVTSIGSLPNLKVKMFHRFNSRSFSSLVHITKEVLFVFT